MNIKASLIVLAALLLSACSSTAQLPAPASAATGTPTAAQPSLAVGAAGHAFYGTLTVSTAPGTGDLDCRDFASQADSQKYFNSRGGNSSNNIDALDWNHNGVPCEVNEEWALRSTRWPATAPTPTPAPVPTPAPTPEPTPTATPTPTPSSGQCYVNGYRRSNGTYVNGYYRKC